jgi:hypothetical protein
VFKFFRKYNTWLLAVFGTLLVIVFLIPQVVDILARAGQQGASIATVGKDGDGISASTWQRVLMETGVISDLGLGFPGIGQVQTPEHWYLLTREADSMGLIGGVASSGVDDLSLAILSQRLGGRYPASIIRETFTKINGVNTMLGLFVNGDPLSDRRLRTQGRKLFDSLSTRIVVLEGQRPEIDIDPTDELLQSQLDAYRDVEPGQGDHGFGYRLPNRYKLEWLEIPAATVRDAVQASDAVNGRAIRKYWRQNELVGNLPPVDSTTDIPDEVKTAYIDELTKDRLKVISRSLTEIVRAPRRGFSTSGGFTSLPDDWADLQVSLDDVATQVQAEQSIDAPIVTPASTEWLGLSDATTLPGIGVASTRKYGAVPMRLVNILGHAKEFGGTATYQVQEGVAGPVFSASDGSLYLWRLTDTDPSRAPVDVFEVRQALTTDLNKMAHFKELQEEADALAAMASINGLDTIAEMYSTSITPTPAIRMLDPLSLQLQTAQGLTPSPQPTIIPPLRDSTEVVKAAIEHAMTLPDMLDVADLTDRQRIIAISSPDNLAVVLIEITGRSPMTQELFQQVTRSAALQALVLGQDGDPNEGLKVTFDQEALSQRHHFRSGNDQDDDAADADADPDADTEG